MASNKAHGDLWDPAISANPQRDNGATVLYGGNITGTGAVTNAPDMEIAGAGRKPQPKPVQSSYVGATIANSSGSFAVLTAGHYVVKGGNVTTQLAGVAYRGLRGGGNQNQIRGIHTLLTRNTVLITSWNYATGEATFAGGNPSSDNFDAGVAAGGSSSYVIPTRVLPGNLVMMEDGKTPKVSAYNSKTG